MAVQTRAPADLAASCGNVETGPFVTRTKGVRLTTPLGFGEADRLLAAREESVNAAMVLMDRPPAAIVLADEERGRIAAKAGAG